MKSVYVSEHINTHTHMCVCVLEKGARLKMKEGGLVAPQLGKLKKDYPLSCG